MTKVLPPLDKMTPLMLARTIKKMVDKLTPENEDTIKRVYERTWGICVLTHVGMVRPTADAFNALLGMAYAVKSYLENPNRDK